MSIKKSRDKKITGITWDEIVIEGLTALISGCDDVSVPLQSLYKWVETTEYLTDWGRTPDLNWADGTLPSYRASLQRACQSLVGQGKLKRIAEGVYCLKPVGQISPAMRWQRIMEVEQDLMEPTMRLTQVKRIQRNQKLRDDLVNYYHSRCQLCDSDSAFLIPVGIEGRYHVEVHHVDGLAETFAQGEMGNIPLSRVNGVGNLVVLCPHHHAVLHYHYPAYEFDRQSLEWRNGQTILEFNLITLPHADAIRKARVD